MEGDRAVLVVDDDRVNRVVLSKLLEREGYRSRSAVDGREALRVLAEERFDAVLLDIVMPEVDGLEVLRRVKGDSALWHIPVIMVSAVDETESIVACLELGAEDYLLKPFDPVLLRARLNGCLARKRFTSLEAEYQKVVNQQAAELEELHREVTQRPGGPAEQEGHAQLGQVLAARLGTSDSLAPHRRPVAVLAAAVGGFNGFCVTAPPEDVLGMLDRFAGVVTGLASRFGATIIAASGPAVTAVFNDPLPVADPVVAAVEMAVCLERELVPQLTSLGEVHGVALHVCAAVAAGEATCGRLRGDVESYVVTGPVVDRACALRDRLAAGGGILLDEPSHAEVKIALVAEPVDVPGLAASPAYRLVTRPGEEGRDRNGPSAP